MDGLIRNYDRLKDCEIPAQTSISHRRPNQREILVERQTQLENALSEVKAALDFFDKNPSFEQGLDILSRALR